MATAIQTDVQGDIQGDAQPARLALPLTPAHINALRHHVSSERRLSLGCIAFCATFAAFLPLIPVPTQKPPFWEGLMLVVFVFGVALILDWFCWRRPLAAAIREGVYFRTTGPIAITTTRRSGATVRVGDARIKYVPVSMYVDLRELPWGTLDYVPGVHAVIEQRDADGELLYRYPAYRPDPDRFEARPGVSVLAGILCGIGSCTVFMMGMFALVVWIDSHR